jgi:hypothetical protein
MWGICFIIFFLPSILPDYFALANGNRYFTGIYSFYERSIPPWMEGFNLNVLNADSK